MTVKMNAALEQSFSNEPCLAANACLLVILQRPSLELVKVQGPDSLQSDWKGVGDSYCDWADAAEWKCSN